MKKKLHLGGSPAYCFGTALALALLLCGPQKAGAQQWTTSGNNISNTNTGNVGVGTGSASPAGKLTVVGSDSLPDDTVTLTTSGTSYGPSLKLDATNSTGGHAWTVASTGSGNSGGAGKLRFFDFTAGAARMTIDTSGNVGIGTASPAGRLHVAGGGGIFQGDGASAGATLQFWKDASATRAANLGMSVPGNALTDDFIFSRYTNTSGWAESLRIQNATGNVGIGTTNPSSKLQVVPTSEGDGVRVVGSTAGPIDPSYGLFDGTTARGFFGLAEVGGAYSASAAAGDVVLRADTGRLHFQTGVGSAAMTISGGNVGIGKTNPSVALDVTGGISATGTITGGNIQATYQDVAEWVPSAQKLSAGTVVVLDTDHANQVLASSKSYDTKVAGVVSAQPGISLGQQGDGKLLVATTGRVKVKVDATRAPIKVGDLLVTSDVEGVAMKSIPVDLGGTQIHRPGTIIGKALEPLEKGTGEILVLLSLQ